MVTIRDYGDYSRVLLYSFPLCHYYRVGVHLRYFRASAPDGKSRCVVEVQVCHVGHLVFRGLGFRV